MYLSTNYMYVVHVHVYVISVRFNYVATYTCPTEHVNGPTCTLYIHASGLFSPLSQSSLAASENCLSSLDTVKVDTTSI